MNTALTLPETLFSKQDFLQELKSQHDRGISPIASYKNAINAVRNYLDSEFKIDRNIRDLIQ